MSDSNPYKDVNFRKETYEVRYTGKKYRKPAKDYVDFNGYDTHREASVRKQLGLYQDGILMYTVSVDGRIMNTWNSCIGNVRLVKNESLNQ